MNQRLLTYLLGQGELVTRSDQGGTRTETYDWKHPDGTSLRVTMENGEVIKKDQRKPENMEERPVADTIHGFKVETASGEERSLADYKGKTLLIVNTASKCGLTPQYASLEKLREKYAERGFEVLAFPANDFLWQEPGTNEEIQKFCEVNYAVTFPVFAKLSVKGGDIAPLYSYLTKDSGFPGDIEWNFAKFLVAPDGKVVARFNAKLDPLAPEIVKQVEETLPN